MWRQFQNDSSKKLKSARSRTLTFQALEVRNLMSATQGDYDGNGLVDGADFLAWQRTPTVAATASLEGWKDNFGREISQGPTLRRIGDRILSDETGASQIKLATTTGDSEGLTYRFDLIGDAARLAEVSLVGDLLSITPKDGEQGEFQIRVAATDARGEDSVTFKVNINRAVVGEHAVDRLLPKWLELGGESGIGAPLSESSLDDQGRFIQEFEQGRIAWSESDGYVVTDYRLKEFLLTAPSISAQSHDRRPSLLVITQGASTDGHFVYKWQTTLAENMRRELEAAGSQVHVMIVQWDSLKPNDVGVDFASDAVRHWLDQREQLWDVTLVGHSRGAIFNQELAQTLGGHANINLLQHVMLDPTASIIHGDQYPNSTPSDVDKAVVYDDGYVFIPTAVNDGQPVAGADYRRVHVSGMGYQDSVGSHGALADQYAADDFHADLKWLLEHKPVAVASYVHETGIVGNQVIMAPGPDDARSVVDIGFDANENGNLHGWITTPIGGVDVTIGKQGLDVGAGVAVIGSAGVSISDDGWMVRVNAGNGASGGVLIGADESRIDVNFLGMHINVFGKDAGLFVGGKKISINRDAALSPGAIVFEAKHFDSLIRETYQDGRKIAAEAWDDAGGYVSESWNALGSRAREIRDSTGNYVKERWNAGGDYLLERGNALGKTYAEARDALGALVSKGWVSAGQWTTQAFGARGQVVQEWKYFDSDGAALNQWRKWTDDGTFAGFEEFTADGKKIIDKWLNSSGQWISQRLDEAGNVLEQWTYFEGYGSQLYQWRKWTAAGALSGFEEFAEAGHKVIDRWINASGQWISQRLDAVGNVLEQWTYFGGFGSQLQQWRKWGADGALTGFEEFTEAGVKVIDKWLNSSGQWISQRLDAMGNVLEQWTYFGGYGSQLYQWRRWATDGALTGFEEFTSAGGKIIDKWLSTSGHWISQRLDGLGNTLEQWTYFGGYGSQLYQWRKWSAAGSFLGFEEFTTSGAKVIDKWLNSSGQWISQELDGFGKVLRQWRYYGGYGSQLQEWATWNASRELTNLKRYTTDNLLTLHAYVSTTGNWVEQKYSGGVEYSVRVWNATGDYLGDQYKNWSDAASSLDPTTKDWWPL